MDGYLRQQQFFRSVSGSRNVAAADTGTIALVAAIARHTIYVQRIHFEVATLTASEVWTVQDGAGTPIPVAVQSAAALGHFDVDFGPGGKPCTEGTALNLVISGATGAVGAVTWEGYAKLTLGAAA